MLQIADLMFTYDPKDPISIGIGKFQYPVSWRGRDVDWSHVQLISSHVYNGVFDVISADKEGVVEKEVNLKDLYLQGIDYAFLSNKDIDGDAQWYIIKIARLQVGTEYDYNGLGSFVLGKDINDPEKWFCSELVKWAYDEAGYPLILRVKSSWTPPNLLWTSAVLEEVEP